MKRMKSVQRAADIQKLAASKKFSRYKDETEKTARKIRKEDDIITYNG